MNLDPKTGNPPWKPDATCYINMNSRTGYDDHEDHESDGSPDLASVELTIDATSFMSGDLFEDVDVPGPQSTSSSTSDGTLPTSKEVDPPAAAAAPGGYKQVHYRQNPKPPPHPDYALHATQHDLGKYMAAVADTSLRTHHFLIMIANIANVNGSEQGEGDSKVVVRITRWDHSAVLVSESFNLCEEEESWQLAAFLHIFADALPSDRGWDTTAVQVGNEERTRISKLSRGRREYQDKTMPMHEHYQAFGDARRMVCFRVDNKDNEDNKDDGTPMRRVAVQTPSSCSRTFHGGFSRVWVVFHAPTTKREKSKVKQRSTFTNTKNMRKMNLNCNRDRNFGSTGTSEYGEETYRVSSRSMSSTSG
jgi:hypothetical protein